MKWGVGCWGKLCQSRCLPGKSASQLNLQLQRIMGQQSLAEYVGIHLDPRDVWNVNNEKQGPEYSRKNGCIINTGNNPLRDERLQKIEENQKRFGLTQEQIDAVVIPTNKMSRLAVVNSEVWEKKARLRQLKETLRLCQGRLIEIKKSQGEDCSPILYAPPPAPIKAAPAKKAVRIKSTTANSSAPLPPRSIPCDLSLIQNQPRTRKPVVVVDVESDEELMEEVKEDSDFEEEEEDRPAKKRGINKRRTFT